MGLDILLAANNQAELNAGSYNPGEHDLSRTFCELICRWQDFGDSSELAQLGQFTHTDLSPIEQMSYYSLPEDLEALLEGAEDELERLEIIARANADNNAVSNNIDQVTSIVEALSLKLAALHDLGSMLVALTSYPASRQMDKGYFSDVAAKSPFRKDDIQVDLRHFLSFLHYAKSKGSSSVFFVFG